MLTRTRKGALDVRAAELRRFERDLHDGAQARLVALTMQLGRAEERVADQRPLPVVETLQGMGESEEALASLAALREDSCPRRSAASPARP